MKSSKKATNVILKIDRNKPQLIEHLRDGYVLITTPKTGFELTGLVVFSETEGINVGTLVVVGTISAYSLYDGEITISNQ